VADAEPELADRTRTCRCKTTVADAESESDADAVADAEPDEVTDEHAGSGGLKQRGSKRLFNRAAFNNSSSRATSEGEM